MASDSACWSGSHANSGSSDELSSIVVLVDESVSVMPGFLGEHEISLAASIGLSPGVVAFENCGRPAVNRAGEPC